MDTGPDQHNILVIDDEPDIVEELSEYLTHKGFRVLSAGDGPAALELFAQEAVDLIITDLLMPGMSGIKMIDNMHRLQPDVPIIAMSGSARGGKEDSLVKAEQAGAAYALSKPLDLRELYAKILEFLPAQP